MNETELRAAWLQEEQVAQVQGWDFSHIDGRCAEGALPWDYSRVIRQYLTDSMTVLDYDTGGGEFLLSLQHPYEKTSATEGYAPNIALCREKLLPLGIDFRPCDDPRHIPFADGQFDVILNRHGDFEPGELHRLLKKDGLFITQQVGEDNDRELVELVLPDTPKPFPGMNLCTQKKALEEAGFQILEAEEAFCPIRFYDVGAFVWFARIIQWEFPDFSVDHCWEKLLHMQKMLESTGAVEGTIHRYLLVAKK